MSVVVMKGRGATLAQIRFAGHSLGLLLWSAQVIFFMVWQNQEAVSWIIHVEVTFIRMTQLIRVGPADPCRVDMAQGGGGGTDTSALCGSFVSFCFNVQKTAMLLKSGG